MNLTSSTPFLKLAVFGSVEIPDLSSLPEIHDEPVFDGYRKGGCRSGGGEVPKNVMKNDEFYGARFSYTKSEWFISIG